MKCTILRQIPIGLALLCQLIHLVQISKLLWSGWTQNLEECKKMSRDMQFPQCGILTSVDSGEPVRLLLSFETQNDIQSVA